MARSPASAGVPSVAVGATRLRHRAAINRENRDGRYARGPRATATPISSVALLAVTVPAKAMSSHGVFG
jgi:hypothetical protein